MKSVGASSRLQVFCITLTLLSVPQKIYADPVAQWLGPWSPTLNPITANINFGGDASAFRSFGDLGDAETLPDTAGSAFSRASADSSLLGGGSASTGVAFNRAFQLSGSPEGWDVTLSARLVGLLFAATPTAPSATVTSGAQIVGGPSVLFGPTSVTPGFQRSIDDAKTAPTVLADGTYAVTGFLTTAASVSASLNPFAVGSAKSDFASRSGDGFFVGVDAVPVPESSTLFLLGLGLIALAQIPLRRLTKKSSSDNLELDSTDIPKQTEAEKDPSLAA